MDKSRSEWHDVRLWFTLQRLSAFMNSRGGEDLNRQAADVLMHLTEEAYTTQRRVAEATDYALGGVNRALAELRAGGWLDAEHRPSEAARAVLAERAPRRAIILAAGYGMRMIPINTESPKGLIEVYGEALIERLIRQLHAVDIREIYVVVGFMKEAYEYLTDEFGVELIVNRHYNRCNNLHSLVCAKAFVDNAYIVPCDVWSRDNPFRRHELYSWYMMEREDDPESLARVNRRQEILRCRRGEGQRMVGIGYLHGDDAAELRTQLTALASDPAYDQAFWEEALFDGARMRVEARVVPAVDVVELNTYEQLRELDEDSNTLQTDAIEYVAEVFGVEPSAIQQIELLEKGMTNRSFIFRVDGVPYIMRIPGGGTEKLIDRRQEATVYAAIRARGLSDELIAIHPHNGYKVTRYLEGARPCDPYNPDEVARCMAKLRSFHALALEVEHDFDLFAKIDFYESLWEGAPSAYRDYEQTRRRVLALRPYLEGLETERILTHIDAVPDNFLFYRQDRQDGQDGQGNHDVATALDEGTRDGEAIRLIDWEYAAMQDPHLDIAMFAIYSLYRREHIDALIRAYFEGEPDLALETKIYAYIAVAGLLWSNWCEFKRQHGEDFGEYSLRQYQYAKYYSRLVHRALADQGSPLLDEFRTPEAADAMKEDAR